MSKKLNVYKILTSEEIDQCRETFTEYDEDQSGSIDVWELKNVLEAMGQKPSEKEVLAMISEVVRNCLINLTIQYLL